MIIDDFQNTPQKISQPWLWLARVGWIVATLTSLTFFIGGLSFRYQELIIPSCTAENCHVLILSPVEADILANLGFSTSFYAFFHVGMEVLVGSALVVLGLFFFLKMSDEVLGMTLAFMLVLLGANFMNEADSSFIKQFPVFLLPFQILTGLTTIPLVYILFVFPNGRFRPKWTRILLVILAFFSVLEPIFRRLEYLGNNQFSIIVYATLILALIVGVWAQVVRYRRYYSQIQKQQAKWVIFGFATLIFCIISWALFFEFFPPEPGTIRLLLYTVFFFISVFLILFFPLSIVLSIMRYRLWEIDIIIRKTLVYTILSTALAAVYFSSVLLIQSVITQLGGQPSNIVVVVSTLLIAAIFSPLRRQIQGSIDRRFYRSSYNAQAMLTNFAETARDEVEMEKLTAVLLNVVQKTMQPESLSVWIRSNSDKDL